MPDICLLSDNQNLYPSSKLHEFSFLMRGIAACNKLAGPDARPILQDELLRQKPLKPL